MVGFVGHWTGGLDGWTGSPLVVIAHRRSATVIPFGGVVFISVLCLWRRFLDRFVDRFLGRLLAGRAHDIVQLILRCDAAAAVVDGVGVALTLLLSLSVLVMLVLVLRMSNRAFIPAANDIPGTS